MCFASWEFLSWSFGGPVRARFLLHEVNNAFYCISLKLPVSEFFLFALFLVCMKNTGQVMAFIPVIL